MAIKQMVLAASVPDMLKSAGIGYVKPNSSGGFTGRIRQDDAGNVKRKLAKLGYKAQGSKYVHNDGSSIVFNKVDGMAQFQVVYTAKG